MRSFFLFDWFPWEHDTMAYFAIWSRTGFLLGFESTSRGAKLPSSGTENSGTSLPGSPRPAEANRSMLPILPRLDTFRSQSYSCSYAIISGAYQATRTCSMKPQKPLFAGYSIVVGDILSQRIRARAPCSSEGTFLKSSDSYSQMKTSNSGTWYDSIASVDQRIEWH